MIKLKSEICASSFVNLNEIIYKVIFIILVLLICLYITGCNKKNDSRTIVPENISAVSPIPAVSALQNPDIIENTTSNVVGAMEFVPSIEEVDYSECFDGFEGCAVFFNSDTKVYQMYNKELCELQTSPCSTFKILATIMGLENEVI